MRQYSVPRPGASGLLVAVIALFLLGRLLIALGQNSLWLDETLTMSFAYNSPHGVWHWIKVLNSSEDPHYPTIYILTRVLSTPLLLSGLPIEYFVRLPIFLAMLAALWAALRWCLEGPDPMGGAILALLVLLVLLHDPTWREHGAEARMYGVMAACGVASVVATHRERFLAAAWCGLAVVALHPFGLMFGLAPVASLILFGRRRATAAARLAVCLATAVLLGLVAFWVQAKFAPGASATFSAVGHSDAVLTVLGALDRRVALAAALLVGLAAWQGTLTGPATLPRLGSLALMLLSVAGFVGGLLLLRPETPPYVRYVAWINPVLATIALVAGATLLGTLRVRPPRWSLAATAGGLSAAVVLLATTSSFGPPWGRGLREAAAHLNATVKDGMAVAPDSYEMVFIARPYRRGFRCERGAQVTAYLAPEVRARIPCQVREIVSFAPDIERVFVVREPIAWVGPRRIDLDGFRQTESRRFDAVTVETYDRVPPEALNASAGR